MHSPRRRLTGLDLSLCFSVEDGGVTHPWFITQSSFATLSQHFFYIPWKKAHVRLRKGSNLKLKILLFFDYFLKKKGFEQKNVLRMEKLF